MGICGLLLLATILAPAQSPEEAIWAHFRAGDLEAIQPLIASIPETSATVEFFHALFETDGEVARAKYERLLADHAGSVAEPYALEKLKEYYRARSDSSSVTFYQKLLDRRRTAAKPTATPPTPAPVVAAAQPVVAASPAPADTVKSAPKTETWTVQVGAFKTLKSAKATGKKVARYGTVSYIQKAVKKGTVTVVQVGQIATQPEAGKLAQNIQSATGLKVRVVQTEK